MPLAPRSATTRSPARGRLHHSTSRTGMDDEVSSVPPAGTAAATVRATPASVGPSSAASCRSMAPWAAASARTHPPAHAPDPAGPPEAAGTPEAAGAPEPAHAPDPAGTPDAADGAGAGPRASSTARQRAVGSDRSTTAAARSGSTHPPYGSTMTWMVAGPRPASHWESTLDAHGPDRKSTRLNSSHTVI